MILKPDADRARAILEEILRRRERGDDLHPVDWWVAAAEALGALRGYAPPKERLDAYRCTFCGASGVKLWRAVHSDSEAWCSRCGTAQAGLADTVDAEGRIDSCNGGRTDQIYSPRQGANLLPCVPRLDGGTWGYTSVPPEGVRWWRALPTRPKKGEG